MAGFAGVLTNAVALLPLGRTDGGRALLCTVGRPVADGAVWAAAVTRPAWQSVKKDMNLEKDMNLSERYDFFFLRKMPMIQPGGLSGGHGRGGVLSAERPADDAHPAGP